MQIQTMFTINREANKKSKAKVIYCIFRMILQKIPVIQVCLLGFFPLQSDQKPNANSLKQKRILLMEEQML